MGESGSNKSNNIPRIIKTVNIYLTNTISLNYINKIIRNHYTIDHFINYSQKLTGPSRQKI